MVLLIPFHKVFDTCFDVSFRLETGCLPNRVNIRIRFRNVSGLHVEKVLFGLLAQTLFQHRDHSQEFNGFIVPDVVESEWCCRTAGVGGLAVPVWIGFCGTIDDTYDTINDVIDIREVTFHLSVVEDINGPAFENRFREQKESHIRASPGAIDRKETQTGRGNSIEMAVGVCHQFVRLFRCSVEAYGVVNIVADREGHLRVRTIHRTAGCVDKVSNLLVTAALQDIEKAIDITGGVGFGVRQRIANTRLGSEVDDSIELFSLEQVCDSLIVDQVQLLKLEVGFRCELGEPSLFQVDTIVIIQIVETDNPIAALEQDSREMEANEASGARDKYVH